MSIPTPIKEIGCQDLIGKVKTKKHGFLRRRTKINGYVDSFISKKWSTNYVLIYDGCIYCYADENKAFYSKARSLYGFDGCSECTVGECGNNNIPWVFKAHNALNYKKSFFFAAVYKNEMKKWIESIQNEIFSVNSSIRTIGNLPKHPLMYHDSKEKIHSDDSDSDYEDVVEARIYTASPTNTKPKTKALRDLTEKSPRYLNISTHHKQSTPPKQPSSSKSPNYFKPITLPKPKPSCVSKSTKTNTHLPTIPPKPFSKPKPDKILIPTRKNAVKIPTRPKGFWDGNVDEEKNLLADKKPGTFLIRKSKSMEHPLTLLVQWNSIPKKFQIFKTNGYYHLEKNSSEGERFLIVDLLIKHYQEHILPSNQELIVLAHPFNHPNISLN